MIFNAADGMAFAADLNGSGIGDASSTATSVPRVNETVLRASSLMGYECETTWMARGVGGSEWVLVKSMLDIASRPVVYTIPGTSPLYTRGSAVQVLENRCRLAKVLAGSQQDSPE